MADPQFSPDENAVAPQGTHLASTQTVKHEYLTQSGKVMRETIKTNQTVTAVMDFIYDESGKPFALNYSTNGGSSFTTYYYVLNLQGDVVKLIDQDGAVAAAYAYDAWGNILSQSGSMASANPLRYRGYYYDSETGFYYLQSRYYDPATRRFINADVYSSTDSSDAVSCNMFAYCNNNPIIASDENGEGPILDFFLGVGGQYVQDVVRNFVEGKRGLEMFKPTSSVGEYLAAGVTNAIPGANAFVRNAISEGFNVLEKAIKGEEIDIGKSLIKVAANTVLDGLTDKVSDKLSDYILSKSPRNYSQYAHKLRQGNSGLTRQGITQKLVKTSSRYYSASRLANHSVHAAESYAKIMLKAKLPK